MVIYCGSQASPLEKGAGGCYCLHLLREYAVEMPAHHQIAVAIFQVRRQIALIREYRTRLISDVVTGKIDVRDIPVEVVPEDESLGKIIEFGEMEEKLNIEEAQDEDE